MVGELQAVTGRGKKRFKDHDPRYEPELSTEFSVAVAGPTGIRLRIRQGSGLEPSYTRAGRRVSIPGAVGRMGLASMAGRTRNFH